MRVAEGSCRVGADRLASDQQLPAQGRRGRRRRRAARSASSTSPTVAAGAPGHSFFEQPPLVPQVLGAFAPLVDRLGAQLTRTKRAGRRGRRDQRSRGPARAGATVVLQPQHQDRGETSLDRPGRHTCRRRGRIAGRGAGPARWTPVPTATQSRLTTAVPTERPAAPPGGTMPSASITRASSICSLALGVAAGGHRPAASRRRRFLSGGRSWARARRRRCAAPPAPSSGTSCPAHRFTWTRSPSAAPVWRRRSAASLRRPPITRRRPLDSSPSSPRSLDLRPGMSGQRPLRAATGPSCSSPGGGAAGARRHLVGIATVAGQLLAEPLRRLEAALGLGVGNSTSTTRRPASPPA